MGPEESFQSAVIAKAHLCGWVVAAFGKARVKDGWRTPCRANSKGWLDLFLCHERRGLVLARELKIPPNKLTPEQADWLRILNACGIDAGVWTPKDWPAIDKALEV